MTPSIESLWADIRFAFRQLARRPTFAALLVTSLGLGMGANLGVLSLASQLFTGSSGDGLVAILLLQEGREDSDNHAHANWRDLREWVTTLDEVAGAAWNSFGVRLGDRTHRVPGQLASGNYFSTLGVRALHGRSFSPEDDEVPGRDRVVVVSHHFWQRWLGGRPGVVGSTLEVNREPLTVIGIMGPEFRGIRRGLQPDLWVPMALHADLLDPSLDYFDRRFGRIVHAFGRLAPGSSLEEASQELAALGRRLQEEHPESHRGRDLAVVPLDEVAIQLWLRDDAERGTLLLAGASFVLLLLACLNVSSLLLVRAWDRRSDVAVRLALGMGRSRLLRQSWTENLVLAVLGGGASLVVGWAVQRVLLRSLAAGTASWEVSLSLEPGLDGRGLVLLAGLVLLGALLFGLIPALQTLRGSTAHEIRAARTGGRDRVRQLVVVVQVALSFVALLGAGLFLRSVASAERIDPGVETRKLGTVTTDLAMAGYDRTSGPVLLRSLLEDLERRPEVERAAASQFRPLRWTWQAAVGPEGVELDPTRRTDLHYNVVTPGYFEVLGIPKLEGRTFEWTDDTSAPLALVLNRKAAALLLPDVAASERIGRRLQVATGDDPLVLEVVGVVEDSSVVDVGQDEPQVYLALLQHWMPTLEVSVRGAGTAAGALQQLVRALPEADPGLIVEGAALGEEMVAERLWGARLAAGFLASFGLVALLLAAVGLFSVLGHEVRRRRREIGLRVALGATPWRVFSLLSSRAGLLIAGGLALGVPVGLGAGRLVRAFLFVEPTDPVGFLAAAGLLVFAGGAALVAPAWRALQVAPTEALREQA